MDFIDNIRNSIDFFLRNNITLSRKNYSEKAESINKTSFSDKQKEILNRINEIYDLRLIQNSTNFNFLMNLYYIILFDKYLSKNSSDNISILDIGSKNWEYVKSEYLFFNSFSKQTYLTGIELDAYRLCTNLYNRYEIAKFHSKDLPNTNYIAGDFLNHNKKYDYIIWILPFITKYPLIKWGLPLKYFKPKEMLKHAYNLLNNGGELLIINQGEEEYKIQQNLNKDLELKAEYYGLIEDFFDTYKNKRFCSKIVKK